MSKTWFFTVLYEKMHEKSQSKQVKERPFLLYVADRADDTDKTIELKLDSKKGRLYKNKLTQKLRLMLYSVNCDVKTSYI